MPPKGSTKKQPKIRTAFAKATTITDKNSSDDSEEDSKEDEIVQTTPVRTKPRKQQTAAEERPVFDASYEEQELSVTIEKKGGHLPLVWFNSICDYLDEKANLYDCSTEVGPRAGHLHLQGVVTANCLVDEPSLKKIKNEMKTAMNLRWGDGSGCLIHLKVFGPGQTVIRMIGYVRKDRNLSTFRNRNKNVSEDMIAQGISEHETLKMSFTDGKILITKNNLFQKVWQKWFNELAPAKPRFSEMATELLNDKNHILSANILMNSAGQMRAAAPRRPTGSC